MRQTDAIRQALAELGVDATREDVESWVKARGVKPGASFGAIVSQEKRKLKEGEDNPAAVQVGAEIAPATSGKSPLEIARELRKLVGKPEDFRGLVDRVERAVNLAGGFRELREFLSLFEGG